MSIDEKTLVVSFSGYGTAPEKVNRIKGEYIRTEPTCFRKEAGGKVYFSGGYWYILNKLGETVAWVEGGAVTVPRNDWQTRGEGSIIFSSREVIPITVDYKRSIGALMAKGPGCLEGCSAQMEGLKKNMPKDNKTMEGVKARASAASGKASEMASQYAPVVKDKGKQAYTACFDFWTHPETVDTMKTFGLAAVDGVKYCAAGCLAVMAGLIDQAVEEFCTEKKELPASESDPAMSYVKVDNTKEGDRYP